MISLRLTRMMNISMLKGENKMAVKIRLRRMGAKKAPFYRVVVADSRYPRDGRFIEEIGTYDPTKEPALVNIDTAKADEWIKKGAQQGLYMKELLVTIASALVEDKSAVQVTVDEPDAEGVVVYHLHVAQEDMGRVIGKQGRIAKAIRTVMRAGAVRADEKISVEID